MKTINIEVPEQMYNLIHDYCYEEDIEIKDFCFEALIEKFNAENTIFNCELDEKGNMK